MNLQSNSDNENQAKNTDGIGEPDLHQAGWNGLGLIESRHLSMRRNHSQGLGMSAPLCRVCVLADKSSHRLFTITMVRATHDFVSGDLLLSARRANLVTTPFLIATPRLR